MRTTAIVAASAVLGIALLVGLTALASAAGVLPRLPAYGGEDDFELRTGVYVLVVCPIFGLIGGAIGYHFRTRWLAAVRAWAGVLAGMLGILLLSRLGAGWFERIDSREVANACAILFWIALATGAAIGGSCTSRLSRRTQ